jgi:hypothetical protein
MVLPRCIDDNDVNTCFAADLLKSINKQRNLRADTDPVKADSEGDKALAKAIKDIFSNAASAPTDEATFTTKLKEQMGINSSYKNCQQVIFSAEIVGGTAPANLKSTTLSASRDLAAARLAEFGAGYDATKTAGYAEPIPAAATQAVFKASETTAVLITADQVKSFMQMVWKKNEKVGIGYKDLDLGTDKRSLIALWFCKGASSYDTHTDNVGKACMVAHDGTTGAKYNECFNNYQLK